MTRPSDLPSDLEIMELADGERDDDDLAALIEHDPEARAKREAIHQIGELVRGHLELSADAVHDAKFAAMWRRIDGQLVAPATGFWSRVAAWFDRYRGHVITGHVDMRPVALRTSPEVDAVDTPGGSSTVINLDDEDGHAAVIWVSAADEPEAI